MIEHLQRSGHMARRVLYAFAAYVSIVGVVTFSLFILEESIQMATFGTWPAADARDYRLVKRGCDVIASANRAMKVVNYSIGWVQPFAFLSYRAYAKSTDYYLDAMRAKIFAHDPGVMVGERVTATISLAGGKVVESGEGRLIHRSKNAIFVLFPYALIPASSSLPASPSLRVSGLIARDASDRVILHVDFIHPVD